MVIGVQKNGSKRFLALEPGYRESKESWAEVLRQLKARGVKNARLFVGDGNLGLWAAVGEVYPQAEQQLCWNHKMLNVMDAVSKKEQTEVKKHLNAMMYADSREQALKERKKFEHAFSHNPKAVKTVVENWEKLTITTIFPARTGNTYGPRTWWNPRSHGCGLEPQHRDDSNRRSTQPV